MWRSLCAKCVTAPVLLTFVGMILPGIQETRADEILPIQVVWKSTALSRGSFKGIADRSTNGRLIAAAVQRKDAVTVEILDTVQSSVVGQIATRPMSIAFSPDGTQVATAPRTSERGSTVCELSIWSVKKGMLLKKMRSSERISSLAFSPDGRLLLCGIKQYFPRKTREAYGYGGVLLLDVATGVVIDRRLVPEANHIVRHVAFAADGRHVAAASNRQVDIWSVQDQTHNLKHVKTLPGGVRVTFSPDGRFLASSSPEQMGNTFVGKVLLYDTQNQSSRIVARHDATKDGTILGLDFSRDGSRLLTAGFDGVVKIWDIKTGEARGQIRVLSPGTVAFASFGADEQTILTIDSNGELKSHKK